MYLTELKQYCVIFVEPSFVTMKNPSVLLLDECVNGDVVRLVSHKVFGIADFAVKYTALVRAIYILDLLPVN